MEPAVSFECRKEKLPNSRPDYRPREFFFGGYCEPSPCAREMKTSATDLPNCLPALLSIS